MCPFITLETGFSFNVLQAQTGYHWLPWHSQQGTLFFLRNFPIITQFITSGTSYETSRN